jgi:hypothetical protein
MNKKEAIRAMLDGDELEDSSGNLFKWDEEANNFSSMFREGNDYYWKEENNILELSEGLEIRKEPKDKKIEKINSGGLQGSLERIKINELIDAVNLLNEKMNDGYEVE